MKIAASSYCFQRLINSGAETQVSIIKLAVELGFEGMEYITLSPPDGCSQAEYAVQIKEEAMKHSLTLTSYAVGADDVEKLKEQVDIAGILGVPVMRHDIMNLKPPFPSFHAVLPRAADLCREVAAYAEVKGIVTTVENHGFFFQDSERLERLYAEVNHPNFGLLVDIGNFLCVDEDPVHAVSRLASYARLAHAKDFHVKSGSAPHPGKGFFPTRAGNLLRGAIVGHGEVPVQQCLRIMKNAGYDGFVSIEFEGIEDSLIGVGYGLENLKRYITGL
jgi:sugar phosphate isomerase/epimerase